MALGKLGAAERKLKELSSREEALRESFFYEGYDKGYQSAVVDAYLGKPLYMVEESSDGDGAIWKKIEMDEANKQKIRDSSPIVD